MVIDLVSPLPRDECALRLTTALATSGAVNGTVGHTWFRLRKKIHYRNSFQASLSGDMIEVPQGTRLRCKVGLHPFVTVFLFVWIGVVTVGCIAMIASLLLGSIPARQWPQAGIPFLMLAFGTALLKFGQSLARGEADFLIDFVRKTVEARAAETIAAD